jgi:hypothetical protein
MATTKEALRAQIAEFSTKIHDIKKAAFKSEKAEKWSYVLPDGSPSMEYSEGCSWQPVQYDKVTSCINPKHADWHSYQHLRRKASVHLTAMAILKAVGENADLKSIPKDEAIAALRARSKALSNARGQAGFRSDARHAARAWRRLKKIAAMAPAMVCLDEMASRSTSAARIAAKEVAGGL